MIPSSWLAPLVVPLLIGVLLTARPGPRTSWLLVVAPLPAALLAFTGAPTPGLELPWLLLDVHLALDDVGRALLGLTALVWTVAGVYSRREVEQRGGYAAWWLLSLTGNVGVILADDVLSFYTAFVLMTLAAYGLVVHTRSRAARRAGRVYIVLGVAGETLLLAGLLVAAVDAPGLRLGEVAGAVGGSSQRDLVVALLVAGFGIKAGVIGLHVWLPLAHPAAPFAASAVLSGAMIKAGLVGWLRLLPIGALPLPGWSMLLIALGLGGAFLGVAFGLTQRAPKVVLAYSSVSQMGFVTLLVGVALGTPVAAPVAVAAAATYALHHGIAKAVLFLGVGLLPGARPGWRRTAVLVGVATAGLSLAGAPLTSGAFAKAWMKQSLDLALLDPRLATAASLAAVGTTLLMARLLLLLTAQRSAQEAAPVGLGPWCALTTGMLVLTPLVAPRLFDELVVPGRTTVVAEALWPVVLGAAVATAAAVLQRRRPMTAPALPPGDLVVLGERSVTGVARRLAAVAAPVAADLSRGSASARDAVRALAHHAERLDRLEDRLTRWRTGGAMVALLGVALLLTLGASNV